MMIFSRTYTKINKYSVNLAKPYAESNVSREMITETAKISQKMNVDRYRISCEIAVYNLWKNCFNDISREI